jgi:LPS O-antigen subunit length determinant protein (WzzB/FepE family)
MKQKSRRDKGSTVIVFIIALLAQLLVVSAWADTIIVTPTMSGQLNECGTKNLGQQC